MKKADTNYKVTGILTNGKRFKAIHTNSPRHAAGINLYRGTVWANDAGTWRIIQRVWN